MVACIPVLYNITSVHVNDILHVLIFNCFTVFICIHMLLLLGPLSTLIPDTLSMINAYY